MFPRLLAYKKLCWLACNSTVHQQAVREASKRTTKTNWADDQCLQWSQLDDELKDILRREIQSLCWSTGQEAGVGECSSANWHLVPLWLCAPLRRVKSSCLWCSRKARAEIAAHNLHFFFQKVKNLILNNNLMSFLLCSRNFYSPKSSPDTFSPWDLSSGQRFIEILSQDLVLTVRKYLNFCHEELIFVGGGFMNTAPLVSCEYRVSLTFLGELVVFGLLLHLLAPAFHASCLGL